MKKILGGVTALAVAIGGALLISQSTAPVPTVSVSWTGAGTLQSSTNLVNWRNETTATNSPAKFPTTQQKQFFRLVSKSARLDLFWSASASTNVAGYNLYYGPDSAAYTKQLDAGLSVSATVTNLQVGGTYYFAVTAYDSDGDESPFSPEVKYQIPVPILTITL